MTTIRQLEKKIKQARDAVNNELSLHHKDMGHIGQALQREGFAGGYLEALNDIQAAITGFEGNGRYSRHWNKDQ